jgi:hypothetical protein
MPSSNGFTDPVRFAEQLFGVKLWDAQRAILRAIAAERRLAVKACHASGKTFAAAIAALWFACRYRDARVLILAPGWLTVRAVIWAEIHSLLARAKLRLPASTVNLTEIRFGPGNMILGLSSNESARLQGHHASHVLIIADEAPGIPEDFWPAIEGILAGGDTHLALLGNPTVNAGYFYDAFGRNRAAWSTFSISAFDTPNLAGVDLDLLLKLPDAALDENTAPYLTTRRWVKERYGEWFNGSAENSPLWQSRVLGEFPSSSSNALIPLSWLEAARRPVVQGVTNDVIIGVDVAGPGKDRTVCVATSGGAILETAAFTDADARGPVLEFIGRWSGRLKLVRVDSAGIGFYFLEHIRTAGHPCVGINVGSVSAEPERFRNLKAERYWHLRQRFQAGEVSGLSDEMLAELASISYLIDPHGRTVIEDKASVKATLGRSPDLAEALMLALGELPPKPWVYQSVLTRTGWNDGTRGPGASVAGMSFGTDGCRARDAAEDERGRSHLSRWGKKWAWA